MTLILPQPTDTTKAKSHSKLHRVYAVDNGASDQTVVANANNSITVNSTILANSFVGNLTGNASTVTNGVYRNTNNTFTGSNTFTNTVVVPTATANTNPVTLGQLTSILNSLILGVNQTWQNLSGSRLADTTYTNTTGKPIAISAIRNGTDAGIILTIDGLTIARSDTSQPSVGMCVFGIIPNGSTYRITTIGGTTTEWYELR